VNPRNAVVLVTGAASGLGLGVARVLHDRGAAVVMVDLPTSDGAALAEDIGGARFAACDITRPEQVEAAFGSIPAREGRLDCVVSCAGILQGQRILRRDGTVHDLDRFTRHLDVNVTGTFDVMRQAVRVMSEQEPSGEGERGLVVNIASIAANEGQIGQVAYAASKGAVASMTLPAARELGPLGIRVVAIAPGPMDTPMLSGLTDDAREHFAADNAFPKRMGTPADLGGLVAAVMENVFLNGTTIRFDAGLRMGPQ
jgi:3-hydroxyacyl-CoA dehydrogenase/3-hydroxy-2-methylbutyryl-CoA dehydrogenase